MMNEMPKTITVYKHFTDVYPVGTEFAIALYPEEGNQGCGTKYIRADIAQLANQEMLEALKEIVARNEIQHWFNLDQAKQAIERAEQKEGT